jgi:hypothetical protein
MEKETMINKTEIATTTYHGKSYKFNTVKTNIKGYPITLTQYDFYCYNENNHEQPDIKSVWATDLHNANERVFKQWKHRYKFFDVFYNVVA